MVEKMKSLRKKAGIKKMTVVIPQWEFKVNTNVLELLFLYWRKRDFPSNKTHSSKWAKKGRKPPQLRLQRVWTVQKSPKWRHLLSIDCSSP